jgi:hypothetical protein
MNRSGHRPGHVRGSGGDSEARFQPLLVDQIILDITRVIALFFPEAFIGGDFSGPCYEGVAADTSVPLPPIAPGLVGYRAERQPCLDDPEAPVGTD